MPDKQPKKRRIKRAKDGSDDLIMVAVIAAMVLALIYFLILPSPDVQEKLPVCCEIQATSKYSWHAADECMTLGAQVDNQLCIPFIPQETPALEGVCTDPRPSMCVGDANPVCGNNKVTYTNECVACGNQVVTSWTRGKCPVVVGMRFYGNTTYRVW